MLTIGIGVRLHLAVCPDQLTVPVHICPASIAALFKAEHLRTGHCIPGSRDMGIFDLDDVLTVAHVAVVDVQRSFTEV